MRQAIIIASWFAISPAYALTATQIANAFGLDVSPLITEQQRETLSPEFSELFQNRADLTASALIQYLGTHPLELEPFRRYLQILVDCELIEPDLANDILEQGIRQFSMRPLRPLP